jgi:hypothetical protein
MSDAEEHDYSERLNHHEDGIQYDGHAIRFVL